MWQRDEFAQAVKLTHRERRFINFASVEYGGQLYMTPQDFLDSVTEAEPRRNEPLFVNRSLSPLGRNNVNWILRISARVRRRVLTKEEIEDLKSGTPPLKRSNIRFFRTVSSKGETRTPSLINGLR